MKNIYTLPFLSLFLLVQSLFAQDLSLTCHDAAGKEVFVANLQFVDDLLWGKEQYRDFLTQPQAYAPQVLGAVYKDLSHFFRDPAEGMMLANEADADSELRVSQSKNSISLLLENLFFVDVGADYTESMRLVVPNFLGVTSKRCSDNNRRNAGTYHRPITFTMNRTFPARLEHVQDGLVSKSLNIQCTVA